MSQELQATGSAWTDRLRWVTGLWYFKENAQDLQPINLALERFQGAANFDPQTFIVNQWTSALMSYLSAERGSKSGGFNGRAQTEDEFNEFQPERVTTATPPSWLKVRMDC